jgi:nitrite reductase (NADH) small subunit
MKERIVVGRIGDFAPGSCTLLPIGKFGVGIFNIRGQLWALNNYCPHAGAPVCLGKVTGTAESEGPGTEMRWKREGEVLRCPWHGWEFDIANGESITQPIRKVLVYDVELNGEEVVLHAAGGVADDSGSP